MNDVNSSGVDSPIDLWGRDTPGEDDWNKDDPAAASQDGGLEPRAVRTLQRRSIFSPNEVRIARTHVNGDVN